MKPQHILDTLLPPLSPTSPPSSTAPPIQFNPNAFGPTSAPPSAISFPSEGEISACISKLRLWCTEFGSLLGGFSTALAALTRSPLEAKNAELLAHILAQPEHDSQYAPVNISLPLQTPSSSTASPAQNASIPWSPLPSCMPTAEASRSTGGVQPAKLLDSRLALEYFRLEAHCENMPPVIGPGDFVSLMDKLVGLVKIGYSFKFYPQRCRCTAPDNVRGYDGIILRKNENGTYRVKLDNGLVVETVKPWEVIEIA